MTWRPGVSCKTAVRELFAVMHACIHRWRPSHRRRDAKRARATATLPFTYSYNTAHYTSFGRRLLSRKPATHAITHGSRRVLSRCCACVHSLPGLPCSLPLPNRQQCAPINSLSAPLPLFAYRSDSLSIREQGDCNRWCVHLGKRSFILGRSFQGASIHVEPLVLGTAPE